MSLWLNLFSPHFPNSGFHCIRASRSSSFLSTLIIHSTLKLLTFPTSHLLFLLKPCALSLLPLSFFLAHLRNIPSFRVGRSLPRLQENVCFLCYPPAFAAVPQDLFHTSVALLPLTEPDKRLSHIRLLDSPFRMPPPYDMGPGLCGFSVSATLPKPRPG